MPFNNEERFLEQLVLVLLREDFYKEIILVNDGSVDKSKIIALNLEESYENISLSDPKENKGKGYAIQLSFKKAAGD